MNTRAKKIRKQVTLTPEAVAWLETVSVQHGLTFSTMLEQLVRAQMLTKDKEAKARHDS